MPAKTMPPTEPKAHNAQSAITTFFIFCGLRNHSSNKNTKYNWMSVANKLKAAFSAYELVFCKRLPNFYV
ncbi:hypothetical protein CGH97_24760 [Vibrio parahaemolyticus]|nr:hypothetical protein CGH97_24760 [Vibrio parahaemolyticus]